MTGWSPVKDELAEIKDLQKTLTSEYDTMRESDRAEDVTRLFQLHGSLSADRKKLESAIKAAGARWMKLHSLSMKAMTLAGKQSTANHHPHKHQTLRLHERQDHRPHHMPLSRHRSTTKTALSAADGSAKPSYPKPQPTVTPTPKPVDIARATWVCEEHAR